MGTALVQVMSGFVLGIVATTLTFFVLGEGPVRVIRITKIIKIRRGPIPFDKWG